MRRVIVMLLNYLLFQSFRDIQSFFDFWDILSVAFFQKISGDFIFLTSSFEPLFRFVFDYYYNC